MILPVITLLAFVGLHGISPVSAADFVPRFLEVGETRGLVGFVMANGKGGSAVAADYDGDGDVDVFAPTESGVPDRLYRNRGDGVFDEIAQEAGVASVARGRAALWFDCDGDDLLDLVVAGDCWRGDSECPTTTTHRLYRQTEPSRFEDVTAVSGFGDDFVEDNEAHRSPFAAADFDGDGDLDLVAGLWAGRARLLVGNGDCTFVDVGSASGIGVEFTHHWQPLAFDLTGNGYPELLHAIDFDPNRFWMNLGSLEFVESSAASGLDNAWNDMGVTLGDYDNDGDLDLYVTNIRRSTRWNELFENVGPRDNPTFERVSERADVRDGGWGWGTTFFDADNDGDLDLVSTNGWFSGGSVDDPSKFFVNDGGVAPVFTNQAEQAGLRDELWGSSYVAADFDRDGDLDLLQACNGSGATIHALRLLDNQLVSDSPSRGGSAPPSHLVVRPRLSGPNRRAIGATVRIETETQNGVLRQMRPILAGTSAYGQEPAEAFFGLGTASSVARVVVEWPSGGRSTFHHVRGGQVLTVTDTGPVQVPKRSRLRIKTRSSEARIRIRGRGRDLSVGSVAGSAASVLKTGATGVLSLDGRDYEFSFPAAGWRFARRDEGGPALFYRDPSGAPGAWSVSVREGRRAVVNLRLPITDDLLAAFYADATFRLSFGPERFCLAMDHTSRFVPGRGLAMQGQAPYGTCPRSDSAP